MRVFLLTLLLTVCVSGGVFSGIGDKVKTFIGGEGSLGEKIKNAALAGLKKALNVTKLLNIHKKLVSLNNKIKQTLQLTPKMMASLKERLSKIRNIKHDHVNEAGDSIEEINKKSEVAELLFQSDIVLTQDQADEVAEDIEEEVTGVSRRKRQAFRDSRYPNTTWMDGVSYFFDPSASVKVRNVFKKAVALWQKDTCVNFKEDSKAQSRIRVFRESGCWSYVGRLGKQQDLSLGEGCDTVGIAAHELGHALGLFHTMSRHDRDEFVTVNSVNIDARVLSQFTKQTTKTNDNYNITYDYGSLMHYAGSSGSFNGKLTLVAMDTNYQESLGTRVNIPFYDLLMLNTHYGCLKKCDEDKNAAKCENGGVPHPRDCSICLCPSGYAGKLCTEKPSGAGGCGSTLQATTTYQDLESIIGNDKKREEDDFETCYYWIESPPNTQVEIRIDSIDGTAAVEGCNYGGVEIKAHEDQRRTGYRFCAKEDEDLSLLAKASRVPIITYNRVGKTTFKLQYRYVTDGKPGPKPTPKNPVSTFAPRTFNPPAGFVCKDKSICPTLLKADICTSPSFAEDLRWKQCPKSCGYC